VENKNARFKDRSTSPCVVPQIRSLDILFGMKMALSSSWDDQRGGIGQYSLRLGMTNRCQKTVGRYRYQCSGRPITLCTAESAPLVPARRLQCHSAKMLSQLQKVMTTPPATIWCHNAVRVSLTMIHSGSWSPKSKHWEI
jgi:hypothetical protein